MLGRPTPLCISTYTNYLSYIVPDAFSTGRQSYAQIKFFFFYSIVLKDQSLFHRPRNPGTECAWLTPLWVSTYTSYLLYKSSRSVQLMQTVIAKAIFFFNFSEGPVFPSQTKKLRKRMSLVDQLPCGSVLTPAVSCTKFKIHSAHADSPMSNTKLSSSILLEDQPWLYRPKNAGKECA